MGIENLPLKSIVVDYLSDGRVFFRALIDAVSRAEASQDDILLRQRVKEYAERLLFCSPLTFGTHAENVLWKKAFYEPFARFKVKVCGMVQYSYDT